VNYHCQYWSCIFIQFRF